MDTLKALLVSRKVWIGALGIFITALIVKYKGSIGFDDAQAKQLSDAILYIVETILAAITVQNVAGIAKGVTKHE